MHALLSNCLAVADGITVLSLSVLSRVFGAVDKTSSSFSAHRKISNFIIIIIIIIITVLAQLTCH